MVIVVVGHDQVIVSTQGHGFLWSRSISEAGQAGGGSQIPGATVAWQGLRGAQKYGQAAAEQDLKGSWREMRINIIKKYIILLFI